MGRFELTRDQACVLAAALRDIKQAVKEQDHLDALYAGLLYVRRGLLDAYTARDKKEFTCGSSFNHEGVKLYRCCSR